MRTGPALVIGILSYFCLHLLELSPRITPKDDGLDVAWLGLCSSWYSKCLLWLSLLVIPCASVVLLGLRGARYQGSITTGLSEHWGALLLWVVVPTLLCLTLATISGLSVMKLAKLADTAGTSPESESATDLSSMD
jgi:hypothetical protein